MSEARKVHCDAHGWQEECFVCGHIVESLHSGTPVGFHWPGESARKRPDAWCTACEQHRLENGGEWTPDIEEKLQIQLLCGACYDQAKSIWQRGRKLTN